MDGYTLLGYNNWSIRWFLLTTDGYQQLMLQKTLLGLYFAWVILTIIFVEYSIPGKTSKLVVELYML